MSHRHRHRKGRRPLHSKKKPDLFGSLPSDITIDILSRLPIRTIAICKIVCKPWLNLLRSRHFADLHLTKSAPGVVIGAPNHGSPYKIFEFHDEFPKDYTPLTKFNPTEFIGYSSVMQGSADGLILYRTIGFTNNDLYICNPITREYIKLPRSGQSRFAAIGFGVSKISRQHKVIMVLKRGKSNGITKSRCLVYVLGTGIWRLVTAPVFPPALLYHTGCPIGTYLNGNLHWLVKSADESHCISCFDLENETFTTFSIPSMSMMSIVSLVVLGDLLSICQNTYGNEIFIWLMKEYGDEKSWSKEYVIKKDPKFEPCGGSCNVLYPLKVLGGGDILMAYKDKYIVYYSNKKRIIVQIDNKEFNELRFGGKGRMKAMLHTSSFLSLRSFEKEKESVGLFCDRRRRRANLDLGTLRQFLPGLFNEDGLPRFDPDTILNILDLLVQ